MFIEISSTNITNWVSEDLFSLNPCCSSNSMLELVKCLVKLMRLCVRALCTQNTCERHRVIICRVWLVSFFRNFFVSFGLPDCFIRLYNVSLFLIRRRISWFIHGKPSRVPAFLVGINLSMPCSKHMPQFLNICGSKVSEELRLEIPHSLFKLVPICFFIKGMLRGTCLVWLGMVFTSTWTMSWSLRPGKIDTLSIRVGLEVKKRSKMCLPSVGEVTVRSRRQSLKTSRHSL